MSFWSEHHLVHLVATYGPGLIGLVVGLEAMGLPLPAESLVIAAAASLGTTHKPGIEWVVLAGAAGAIIGDNIGYLLGRTLGWRALRHWGHRVGLSNDRLLLGAYLFRRHGGKVVFLGRFIVFLRTVSALLAGANRMDWRWFLVCNAAGGVLWACIYGLAGYWLGRAVTRIAAPVGIALGVVAVGVMVTVVLAIRRNEHALLEQAKREMGSR